MEDVDFFSAEMTSEIFYLNSLTRKQMQKYLISALVQIYTEIYRRKNNKKRTNTWKYNPTCYLNVFDFSSQTVAF